MVLHSNSAAKRSMMTKPREHNQELMKRKRSPSLMTTTKEKDPDLDRNKIINLHQDRTSRILRGITNSLTKTLTEGDLTKEIIGMITGTGTTLSSRTTSITSVATAITLQVIDRLLLILIYETIPNILEIDQIARITSGHYHETQILSTIGISQTTTISQTPYNSSTKMVKTVSTISFNPLNC